MIPPTHKAVIYAVALVMGAVFGSFGNCVVSRHRRGLPWWGNERSRCPACGTLVRCYDNVPILGFLRHRGACHSCKVRIPWRYFWSEVGGVAAAWALVAVFL